MCCEGGEGSWVGEAEARSWQALDAVQVTLMSLIGNREPTDSLCLEIAVCVIVNQEEAGARHVGPPRGSLQ